ncbi:hypothetical protein DFS34DRAFT_605741 [Phlyctochytrium arcticum]|nr:hypothetical protein DFS34DRAFT_605741 [Phlyctochytrium arcticum]
MFDATRLTASIVFLAAMILTLVVAFTIRSIPLVLICCLVQFLALMWYSLSYVPFARDLAKRFCSGLVGK